MMRSYTLAFEMFLSFEMLLPGQLCAIPTAQDRSRLGDATAPLATRNARPRTSQISRQSRSCREGYLLR
jgi:hypothetical protein